MFWYWYQAGEITRCCCVLRRGEGEGLIEGCGRACRVGLIAGFQVCVVGGTSVHQLYASFPRREMTPDIKHYRRSWSSDWPPFPVFLNSTVSIDAVVVVAYSPAADVHDAPPVVLHLHAHEAATFHTNKAFSH